MVLSPPRVASRRAAYLVAGIVASVVAVVLLAGCSSAPAATSDFGTADLDTVLAGVPTDVSSVHGLDLPLDRSLLTAVEEQEVIKARNTLMEGCLANHGITFTFPAVDPERDAARPRRHGLVNPDEAAAYGYRDPAVFAAPRAEAVAAQVLPPDVVSVIIGTGDDEVGGRDVPTGGCAGEADRALAVDASPGQEQMSFALSRRSHEVTRTARPVTAAAAAWSQCMAEAGFDYRDPDAAITDPAFSAGRPSEHEIAVATQDVRCKERVQWVRTWVAVERAVQDVLVRQHAEDLAREQHHKDRQLTVAREVNG